MKIITISREFGSRGRELGKRLADIMNFDYYDSEIIAAVAKKSGLDANYVEDKLNNHVRICIYSSHCHTAWRKRRASWALYCLRTNHSYDITVFCVAASVSELFCSSGKASARPFGNRRSQCYQYDFRCGFSNSPAAGI
jgi:hypothetical protein